MKNDLTSFEKTLLRSINLKNKTRYNYKNLMEWSTDENSVRKNLGKDELVYDALGCYVAINPTIK